MDSRYRFLAAILAVAWFMAPTVDASDLHQLWDSRCADCHGHSADFARTFLTVEAGELRGKHHQNNLRQFLDHHYPPASDTAPLYNMLLAQATSTGQFREQCSGCHDSAAEFVRKTFVLENQQLKTQRSGKPLREALKNHRMVKPADVDLYENLLNRVANEVFHP